MYTTLKKEKPMLRHAIIMVCVALIIALFLASGSAWDVTARITTAVLEASGVKTYYVSPLYLMYVRLLDGTVVGFQIWLECSGLITLLIFSFISALTIGLLKGDLKAKLVWFILSASIGFTWNLSRLATVIAIAYNFGLPAFQFVHFVLAPTVDFVWVVSTWALGMSWLKREAQQ
ncbi:exosortase/archaeosortase family protein [Candidatus Bathyarchaeota archaeon]|nr:exosortase/archaeosortase family protein [Candidatus Bathyarchaeota archaeon]